jgi:hypothetical protein
VQASELAGVARLDEEPHQIGGAVEGDPPAHPRRFDAKGDVDLPAFAIYRWSKGDYAQIDGTPEER